MSLALWINAYDMACPKLKYNVDLRCWIALKEDPCMDGKCGRKDCPNYLDRFSKPDRLIIVEVKQ